MKDKEFVERRAENEASVLRRLVELNLEFQNNQLKQASREAFWKNLRWFAVAIGFVLLAAVNFISISKLSGLGKVPLPVEGEYVSQVRIEGMIAPNKPASAAKLVPILEDAFDDADAKGVLLVINSPGGTPTQAALIYHAIQRLKKSHPNKPVVAVAEDLMASGAYYVAAAADRIYANENSIVGSIGVKLESYGAVGLAEKLGIERRIFAAGEHKVRMDMLEPVTDEDRAKFTHTLKLLHRNFIDAVKAGRGKRLADRADMFSGDFWTASEAKERGLIDGIETPSAVLRKEFHVSEVRDYSPVPGVLTRLMQSAMDTLLPASSFPIRVY